MSGLQENDEHFMNKLHEIVPELRKEIQTSMRNRLSMELQRAKEKKRLQISEKYQEKIKEQIEQSNQKLRVELTGMMERIQKIKRDLNNHRLKRLSKEEQEELIEQTVEQVLGDETMLAEVKERLRPKVETRVRIELEKELQENLESIRRDMIQQLNDDRDIWTKERIDCWNRQSELELSQLAAEHSELSTKRQNMQTVFNGKKMEKRQAEKKWEGVIEKNAKIASLRAELKRLKEIR